MSYNHVLLIAIASFQSAAITKVSYNDVLLIAIARAAIAQLGERQTEDLKVPGSIPGLGISSCCYMMVDTKPKQAGRQAAAAAAPTPPPFAERHHKGNPSETLSLALQQDSVTEWLR